MCGNSFGVFFMSVCLFGCSIKRSRLVIGRRDKDSSKFCVECVACVCLCVLVCFSAEPEHLVNWPAKNFALMAPPNGTERDGRTDADGAI